MILDLCGGEASKPVQTTILENKQHAFDFNTNKIKSLGGVDVPKDRQKSILESLGFSVLEKDNIFSITPPSFRTDVEGEADIVEEILRIYGFNEIPSQPLILPGRIKSLLIVCWLLWGVSICNPLLQNRCCYWGWQRLLCCSRPFRGASGPCPTVAAPVACALSWAWPICF